MFLPPERPTWRGRFLKDDTQDARCSRKLKNRHPSLEIQKKAWSISVERVLSLRQRMGEAQVRERLETSPPFPHPSATKDAALCPLPEGEGFCRQPIQSNEEY